MKQQYFFLNIFGGGIYKLHSYLNLQNVVFIFLVPSNVHSYEKKKKEKKKYLFYSVSSGSHVKRQKKKKQNKKSTPIGLDKREAHHSLTS